VVVAVSVVEVEVTVVDVVDAVEDAEEVLVDEVEAIVVDVVVRLFFPFLLLPKNRSCVSFVFRCSRTRRGTRCPRRSWCAPWTWRGRSWWC
jgi:hypothetical protein